MHTKLFKGDFNGKRGKIFNKQKNKSKKNIRINKIKLYYISKDLLYIHFKEYKCRLMQNKFSIF